MNDDITQRLPFGTALALRREKLGYTQKYLADLLGLHQTTITKLEHRSDPPLNRQLLVKLSPILLGTPEELAAGYIPRGFPLHNVIADSQEFHRRQEALNRSRRKEVETVIQQVSVNLSTLGELEPDEVVTLAKLIEARTRQAERDAALDE